MVKVWYDELRNNESWVRKIREFSNIDGFIDWIFSNEGVFETIEFSCAKNGVTSGVHPLQTWKGDRQFDQPWYVVNDNDNEHFHFKKQWYGYGSAGLVIEGKRIDVDGKCYLNEDISGKQVVTNSFVEQIMKPCIERKKAEFEVAYAD